MAIRQADPLRFISSFDPALAAALHFHCKATREHPADVIADALVLHLDALAEPANASDLIGLVAGEAVLAQLALPL